MDDSFPDQIHAVTPLDFSSSFSHTEFVAWNVIFYHLMHEADNHHSIQNTCLTLNRPGGGIRPQAGSSLCCAETVSSRKPKLCDFYYILIKLNSEYKAISWDIHCCHVNAIVEGCSVNFWLKSEENCNFCSNRFLI